MTNDVAIGVDVGGSSVKVSIHDLRGHTVGSGRAEYAPRHEGAAVEYGADLLLVAVEAAIRDAVNSGAVDPAQVVAISTDAMISGTVGIGADGAVTTSYTTTLDSRFGPDLERLTALGDASSRTLVGSGSPVIAAKIAWYRRTQPEAFSATRVFVTAGGLVGSHLAGLGADEAFIDPTVLWAVGLSDTRRLRWDTELAARLGVPVELLPRIVPSATVVGGLDAAVARRVGLRAGIPVVAGMGDQMAGFLGAGLFERNRAADSSGTFAVVGTVTADYSSDLEGRYDIIPSPFGDGYVQQSVSVLGAGFTRGWLVDSLFASENEDELEDSAAALAPGAEGLSFVPHLGGRANPNSPRLRGAWLGLNWQHDRHHFVRALHEAHAFELRDALDAMQVDDGTELIGYGGGTASRLANQVKANVTARPYVSLGDVAPASLASALFAAHAVGKLDTIGEVLAAAVAPREVFAPQPEQVGRYAALRSTYARAIAAAETYISEEGNGL